MSRLALALAGMSCALAFPGHAARPHYIEARLITQSAAPRPGQTTAVALVMKPRPGWHGYWSNPGESGLAPVVKWTAPAGVRFGALEHPPPTLLRVMGLTSYVHAGPHLLLARMSVDRRLRAGTALPITADVTWAACSDKLCVPERARLSLVMRVGNGLPTRDAVLIRHALLGQPKPVRPGTLSVRAGRVVLTIPPSVRLQPNRTRFYPDANGYWDPVKARVTSIRPLSIASPVTGKLPAHVSGVLSDGSSAYRLSFQRQR